MIDNIILLLIGTLHQRPLNDLMPKCHPLGTFEEMGGIPIASSLEELYNAVLIDTPIAPYFICCLTVRELSELNVEIIRNTVYKCYLEDFYNLCKKIGDSTEKYMCEILGFEADRRAITITINSFGTILSRENRVKLYPRCGQLHPIGLDALSKADDIDHVKLVTEAYYYNFFEGKRIKKIFYLLKT